MIERDRHILMPVIIIMIPVTFVASPATMLSWPVWMSYLSMVEFSAFILLTQYSDFLEGSKVSLLIIRCPDRLRQYMALVFMSDMYPIP